jgi:hypothetical protein
LGAFILEVGSLITLLIAARMVWLAAVLLVKNGVLIVLSIGIARSLRREKGLFESLRCLPVWLVWTDRLSALASGIGFLLFFLGLNGLLNLV